MGNVADQLFAVFFRLHILLDLALELDPHGFKSRAELPDFILGLRRHADIEIARRDTICCIFQLVDGTDDAAVEPEHGQAAHYRQNQDRQKQDSAQIILHSRNQLGDIGQDIQDTGRSVRKGQGLYLDMVGRIVENHIRRLLGIPRRPYRSHLLFFRQSGIDFLVILRHHNISTVRAQPLIDAAQIRPVGQLVRILVNGLIEFLHDRRVHMTQHSGRIQQHLIACRIQIIALLQGPQTQGRTAQRHAHDHQNRDHEHQYIRKFNSRRQLHLFT